jgi:tetratricopeptide (TPR) repeat protein
MAIRGSLTEAALGDVVQLLALGRRTGCLSVTHGAEFGSLWFADGRVTHAALVNRRDRIGEALVRAGALDEADLRAALVEQATEPGTRLGELLRRRGCVEPAALEAALRARVEEACYELLGWPRGTFSFEAEVRPDPREAPAVRDGPGGFAGLDPGALLLEAARRADERALIATEVPGPEAVFAAVAPARPDAEEPPLADDERRVLPLLDARRDVRAVADDAALSEFHAARALHALVRRGRARRVPRAPAPPAGRLAAGRADEHRNLGVAFARAGMLDEAQREFRRVLELQPADAHARLHLGLVALRARRWADAAAVLGEAAALPASSGAVFHALGLARHRLGNLSEADEAFDEAARRGLAGDPRLATARGALAVARGDAVGARRWLADARAAWAAPAASPPGAAPPAEWFHAEALAALAAGDPAGAERALADGVATHPGAAPLLVNAAALAADLGRPEAEALAARAAEADPQLPQAHRLVGDAHYRAGRHAEAAAAYRAAVRLAPGLGAEVWARLGTLAFRDGARAAAVDAWERACKLDPAHPTAAANLDALRRADPGASSPPPAPPGA